MRLGKDVAAPVETIPTGSAALDEALGVGGLPRGRVVEIFGPEGAGKSTLVLHVIAEAQKLGLVAALIDAEHALDLPYARAIGVDLESLLFSQPVSGEEAWEIAIRLARSGGVGLIVVDSIAALAPGAELRGEMGEAVIGAAARMNAQAMRKIVAPLAESNCLLVAVNQIRSNIGQMFGPSETQPGGRALKFAASVRLDIRKIETLKQGEQAIGQRVRVRAVKHRLAAPRPAEFCLRYGEGIDQASERLDALLGNGEAKKSGSWFELCGQRVQGRDAARQVALEDSCA